MQLSQSIRLKQKQSMVMTPRLQQAIRMLQMNNLDLASYLEDQALENPFLEVAANSAEGEETGGNDAFDAAAPDTAQAEASGTIDADMKAGASPKMTLQGSKISTIALIIASPTGRLAAKTRKVATKTGT